MLSLSEQFAALTKSSLELGLRFAAVSLDLTQQVVARQLKAVSDVVTQDTQEFKALVSKARDTDSPWPWSTLYIASLGELPSLYRGSVQKAFDVTRDCLEIAYKTQRELAPIFEEQAQALGKAVADNIEASAEAASAARDTRESAPAQGVKRRAA